MDAYCASAFGEDIQTNELADAHTTTLVAENGEGFLAYAQLVARRAPVAVDATRPIELKRFYVAAPFQGSQLAPALMDRVIEIAASQGCDLLWLGVWEHNPRATRFYSKCGFHEAGEQVFVIGADRQRDLIMLKRLVDAS